MEKRGKPKGKGGERDCHKAFGAYERHYETLDDFSKILTEIIETKSSIISVILFAII